MSVFLIISFTRLLYISDIYDCGFLFLNKNYNMRKNSIYQQRIDCSLNQNSHFFSHSYTFLFCWIKCTLIIEYIFSVLINSYISSL